MGVNPSRGPRHARPWLTPGAGFGAQKRSVSYFTKKVKKVLQGVGPLCIVLTSPAGKRATNTMTTYTATRTRHSIADSPSRFPTCYATALLDTIEHSCTHSEATRFEVPDGATEGEVYLAALDATGGRLIDRQTVDRNAPATLVPAPEEPALLVERGATTPGVYQLCRPSWTDVTWALVVRPS